MQDRSDVDGADFDLGVLLAVAYFFVIAFAALVFDAENFGAFDGSDDVGGDGCAGEDGAAYLGVPFTGDEENAVESDGLFVFADFSIDFDGVTGGDFELGSAVFNNGVHRGSVGRGKSERGIVRIGEWVSRGGWERMQFSDGG
jgi:hypothetical protein